MHVMNPNKQLICSTGTASFHCEPKNNGINEGDNRIKPV